MRDSQTKRKAQLVANTVRRMQDKRKHFIGQLRNPRPGEGRACPGGGGGGGGGGEGGGGGGGVVGWGGCYFKLFE